MNIELKQGKYVVAVSGGVDSVVLLNLLRKLNGVELVVAHFDHGIRADSKKDRLLVEALSKKYALPFYYKEGKLGAKTSEDAARTARYKFLNNIKEKTGSIAIITAHHQDDLIETAVINILRGTKRRGLSSLQSRSDVIRPLLPYTKKQIYSYAKAHKLKWHEDPTNKDPKYLRNYVRANIIPKLNKSQRQELLNKIQHVSKLNKVIDKTIDELFKKQYDAKQIGRFWFISLPHAIAKEYLTYWFAKRGIAYDAKTLERLVVNAKTLKPGKVADISKGRKLLVGKDTLTVKD